MRGEVLNFIKEKYVDDSVWMLRKMFLRGVDI